MVANTKKITLLLTSLVLSIVSLSKLTVTSHLALMKLLAIFVIFCRSTYQNNSNYFLLLIPIYLYSARAKVNAITLLNHLDLLILYNILLKMLRNITLSNTVFIKEQASNYKLVGT